MVISHKNNINDRQQSWLDAQKSARPLYWRYVNSMKYAVLIYLTFGMLSSAFAEEFRELSKNEFDPVLFEGHYKKENMVSYIEYDFDLDGKNDKIIIETNLNISKYRVAAYLSSDSQTNPLVLWEREIPKVGYKGVWEVFWLKPRGEKGESEYKYFNAPGKDYPYLSEHTEKDIKEYNEGIAKYVSMAVIEASNSEEPPIDAGDAFYCKQFYYFENNRFHKLTKCD